MKKTAIYALTPQGAALARRLAGHLEGDLFLSARLSETYGGIPFDRLMEIVSKNFFLYPSQIFIAAAGIVTRTIAPLLRSKDQDPAVIVLDQEGRYVISLLSGHLGGANELARDVARLTGGSAVITTATDTAGVPSMDLLAKERNLAIANLNAVKSVNMAILMGEPIQVFDPEDRLGLEGPEDTGFAFERKNKEEDWISGQPGIFLTWKVKKPRQSQLVLHPRCLVAGVGCNRGTGSQEILSFITDTFSKHALCLKSLSCITTIEAKKDEQGLLDVVRDLDVPLFFFTRSELEDIEVPNPSGIVQKHMGVSSVCEATALLKTEGGRLLLPKNKSRNVTLAIALES